uniref:Si:ch1073-291c23.2 n=1 Tax=Paramormyrops kingsleyae TaxID=1676925 RepID=A0A3B3T0X0_9TELE
MDTLPVFTAGSEATGDTTEVVGFSKPLHRLMRADPKSIGVAMMILGGSQLITGIPMMLDIMGNNAVYGGLWLGTVFVICGILYFLSGSSPSKKLVTANLALSIASLITGALAFMINLSTFINQHREDIYYYDYDINYSNLTNIDEIWSTFHKNQVSCMEGIWLLHCFVGGVILIVMTAFSRAALRSTKTQATVIMYNRPSA